MDAVVKEGTKKDGSEYALTTLKVETDFGIRFFKAWNKLDQDIGDIVTIKYYEKPTAVKPEYPDLFIIEIINESE